ncbi:MAG TPA: aldo/keto reductase [Candidatus Acidoferrales bacterium]|nr:aldo/keto reductase [Candidatus Acidoferrales bacterium]
MIEKAPFGRTGHHSTRALFGAAALGAMKQEKADQVLDLLLEFGINHIDTAASYGDSELRVGPWMKQHRKEFFLATKTGDRTYAGARDSVQRSLDRLCVDQLDLIQLHNLVDEDEWRTAMGPGGALEALIEARERGWVRFIGVTGHGTRVAAMHIRSLAHFACDSVLLPLNYTMLTLPQYAADFERLMTICRENEVAVQTIKSIARRRWGDSTERRFSWYEPLRDAEAIRRAVHFVLGRSGIFLNTSSDATLLRTTLEAASKDAPLPPDEAMQEDVSRFEIQRLFEPGVFEGVS